MGSETRDKMKKIKDGCYPDDKILSPIAIDIIQGDDLISKERTMTGKQWKKIKKTYKQLMRLLRKTCDVKFYDYGDLTITVIKQKKKEKKSTSFADYFSSRKYPEFMTKKERKALAKLDVESACENLGLNRKKKVKK